MDNKETWYYCDVSLGDNVRYEFRCDTFETCVDRVNKLVEKHGNFHYLLISKYPV